MVIIKIPLYFYTEEPVESLFEKLGIPVPERDEEEYEDCEVKEATFYVINAVLPDMEGERNTVIHSNGNSFVSPLSYDEVTQIIEKALCKQ